MFSLVSGLIGLLSIGWIYAKNRPAFIVGFFILASLAYRIIDVVYIDVSGQVFAIELGRYIYGGSAAHVFVLSAMCFIVPLAILLRSDRMKASAMAEIQERPYYRQMALAALCGTSFVIALLYVDMLRIGTIPILSGVDRVEYDAIAGILHSPAYELSFLINIILGIFTVLPRLQGKRYDFRFIIVFMTLLTYWVITGNRFSVFYRDFSFFAMPFAAVLLKQQFGSLQRRRTTEAWSILLSSRLWVGLGIIIVISLVAGLLYNSFFNVRGYSDPFYQIEQRVFVQPVQLWIAVWGDIGRPEFASPSAQVFRDLFVDPIDPTRNTSIQVLMAEELGYFRAQELLFYGQQYAGGYPEIFFLWLGYWFAPLLLLTLGFTTVLLLRAFLHAVCRGYVLTAIFIIYLYFAFTLAYIGGMLNFVLATTFPLKIAAPIIVYLWERSLLNSRANMMAPLRGAERRQPLAARRVR